MGSRLHHSRLSLLVAGATLLWGFLHDGGMSHSAGNPSAHSLTLLQGILLHYGYHRSARECVVAGRTLSQAQQQSGVQLSTSAAVAAPIGEPRLQRPQAPAGSPDATPGSALSPVQSDTPPPVVDYSSHVTFVRKQTGGGCGTMTSLAILDILAERDYAYSPDFSYRFAAHVYNNPLGKLNQLDVVQQYGCCSEASLPTDDDPGKYLVPALEHYEEAAMYKIAAYSPVIAKPSADDLRELLWKYGPVFAAGDVPGSQPHAHVFTIIGYDDRTRMFKVLNSFGDRWGNNGLMDMPYDDLANPPPDNERSTPRVDWVRWRVG